MASNTKVKLKRTTLLIPGMNEEIGTTETPTLTKREEKLGFGEPIFVDNTGGTSESICKAYLAVGPDKRTQGQTETEVRKSIFFKGLNSKDKADSIVFYDQENNTITNESGNPVAVSKINPKKITTLDKISNTKFHIVCVADDGTDEAVIFNLEDAGIFINANAVMNGAAWNDYAESREYVYKEYDKSKLVGKVVCEYGDGRLSLSTEKLQPCAYIVSDTHGMTIGTGNIQIAVSGKVLTHVKNKDELKIGDCVTSGKDGIAEKMTRREIKNYPDRIIGTVVEIPTNDFWKNIHVDGRVWVKLI